MKATVSDYRKYIVRYGILTVLMILEYYESVEEYGECQKIICAISQLNEKFEMKLPTRISNDVVEDVMATYRKLNLTGVYAEENSRYMAEQFIKDNK